MSIYCMSCWTESPDNDNPWCEELFTTAGVLQHCMSCERGVEASTLQLSESKLMIFLSHLVCIHVIHNIIDLNYFSCILFHFIGALS